MSHRILYVIRHLDTGLHKIGITNDWGRRQRELEVGTKTAPVHVVRVNDARQVERFLHRRFKANRMPQSEWFHLSDTQLEFVRTTVLKARSDHQAPQQAQASTPPPEPAGAIIHAPEAESSLPAQPPRQPAAPPSPVPFSDFLYQLGAAVGIGLALLLTAGLVIGFLSESQDAQRAADQAAEKELIAQQEEAEQARLANEERQREEERQRAEEATRQAAIKEEQDTLRSYAGTIQKAAAYDCRFYVWAGRPGDPDVRLGAFTALPDADTSDRLVCNQLAGALGSFMDRRSAFVRDKLLAERGQLPPEDQRYAKASYRLDWPAAQ